MLLGAFCVGYNMAIAFHELGHALAMVLDGVTIRAFHLNPFSWSWTFPESLNHPLFTALGGVTFGVVFAAIPALAAIRIQTPAFRIPAVVTAAVALAVDGIYLVAGTFFRIGDGGELLQYGVSRELILALGGLYVAISLLLFAFVQSMLGIGKNTPITTRALIMFGGIVPYLAVIFLYNLLLNQREILLWISFVSAGIFLILLWVWAGHVLAKRLQCQGAVSGAGVSWTPVITTLLSGMAIVVGELMFFGIKENPF
jgi:hypothetical protein